MMKKYSEAEINALAKQIKYEDFYLAIYNVLSFFGTNTQKLMRDCALDSSTIYKYTENKARPLKRTLLLICIVAGWPTQVSYALLYSAGFVLNTSSQDKFYNGLLQKPHESTIYEVNEKIEKWNQSTGGEKLPLFNLSKDD